MRSARDDGQLRQLLGDIPFKVLRWLVGTLRAVLLPLKNEDVSSWFFPDHNAFVHHPCVLAVVRGYFSRTSAPVL